jgi:hypothetical protein
MRAIFLTVSLSLDFYLCFLLHKTIQQLLYEGAAGFSWAHR